MKKTLIPLLVVASIALMITGCCLGKDDVVNDVDQRYLIKKQGDTLIFKSDNGQTDTFKLGGGFQGDNPVQYDCYTQLTRFYIYSYWQIPIKSSYPATYVSMYPSTELSIGPNGLGPTPMAKGNYATEKVHVKKIDTTINGIRYPEMFHFYQKYDYKNQTLISGHLLYDLSYNKGIVQYRDTSGVLWTLQ